MGFRALLVSAVAAAALVVGTAAFSELSLARAAVLAPVLVLSAGGIAFLVLLWGKVAYESLRGRDRED